jgi:hypothetical protein
MRRRYFAIGDVLYITAMQPPPPKPPTVTVRRRGRQLVIKRCPHCRRRHVHGDAGRVCGDMGHRLSHCLPPYDDRSYYLFLPCPKNHGRPKRVKKRKLTPRRVAPCTGD